MLTLIKLKSMKPDEIIAKGIGKILHPWFNNATKTVDENGMANVKWIAIRGNGYHDWAIYHSLGFETADYLDGVSHLSASDENIKITGSKLGNKEDIKRLVPCDDSAFDLYRS